MRINKRRINRNLEHAQRWLERAQKDFNVFKKLVVVDKRTKKSVRCSDPALAVYLLQQSVEKAVKAAAIASGQYKTSNFKTYYKHNSLGLILNLNQKLIDKVDQLGLKTLGIPMGIDFVEGTFKLATLEGSVMDDDKRNKVKKRKQGGSKDTEKKVDFKEESIKISAEVIDKLLNMILLARSTILDVIRATFAMLPKLGIRKGTETIENPEEFVKLLAESVTSELKLQPLSEAQMNIPIEFTKSFSKYGFPSQISAISRNDMINSYLGVWSFSISLYLLTYITFAHESVARYPRKPAKSDMLKFKNMGYEDYTESLGIVNRIGQIGYVTSLTLNYLKKHLDAIALFFAAEPNDSIEAK